MSETTSEAVVEPVVEAVTDPVDTTQTAQETEQQTQADPAPETEAEPAEKPKPKPGDRRWAHMTARLRDAEAARDLALRQATEAQALLQAQQNSENPAPPQREVTDVDARARELIAQREFDAKRLSLVQDGSKEYGSEAWSEKTEVLHGLGATQNPAFMQALVELPNAAKLVAHLADDADALVGLLGKSPVAMAAEMGRMVAEIGRQPARAVSNAPKPVTPVSAPRVVAEPDAYSPDITMEQYVALRRKTAPRHLGGAR